MEESIILLRTEEARLDQLYHSRWDQNEEMNLTQFLLFALDRNLVSNKFGIEVFYTTFKEAAGHSEILDIK
jgi:uncharacterized lipoprotein YmbA